MLAPDLLDRVAALDTAAICDANKDVRVVDPGLRPVTSFRAKEVQRAEAAVMDRLGRGDPLLDMLNLAEHCAALEEGKPSRLRIRP